MKEAFYRVSDEPFHISDVLVLLVGQQLWGQNMQDLGLCEGEEEGDPCEGFNMADVDLSFDNYEDIFSSTQDLSSLSFDNIEARYLWARTLLVSTCKSSQSQSFLN
jgi:hypothetical protein